MVNHTSKSVSHGVGVRVCAEDRTGYAYSDEVRSIGCGSRPKPRAPSPIRGTRAPVQVGAPARVMRCTMSSTPLEVPVEERAKLLNEIDGSRAPTIRA